ncbi:MAG TPA: hypothetical protein VK116_01960, partial [Planctomycetota bacterium]|nr:hypothetical protein [Planctomycetota bacterium]
RREIRLEPAIVPGAPGHLAIEGAWIRLRYAFLVVGGTSTDELEILAAILADLHATPWVPVLDPRESRRDRERDDASPVPSPFEEGHEGAHEAWPLRTVEAPETWREIGLDEHRLAITFELSLGLPPPPAERLEPILERELDVAIEARAEAQRPDRGGLR